MATVVLKSIEDLHRYNEALAARKVEDDPVVKGLQTAKQAIWLLLLTLAFLFYFLIDCMQGSITLLG